MKKLLTSLLTLAALSLQPLAANAMPRNPFTDVAEDAWYYNEVVKAVDTGIINGKTDTEFMPDDLLTYAEAIKLAACMSQVYLNGEVTLSQGEPWYKPYVDYCRINNIITKEYDYNANATRAEYMEIFAKALPDSAFRDINSIPDGSILDVKDNAPYAIYVYKLYRAGIVTGVDEKNNCAPDSNIKRCEVATIISRIMDEEERVEFDMETIEKINTKYETIEEEDEDDNNNKTENYVAPPTSYEPTITIPTYDSTKTDEGGYVVLPNTDYNVDTGFVTQSKLTIHKQPEGLEAEEYGINHQLEVLVFGGQAPYTYEWYYKSRRDNITIVDGDYVSGATSNVLTLEIEKENPITGTNLYCKITDSDGASVTTEPVLVYGPFSMPVESYAIIAATKDYSLAGRIDDGILKKGEKVSVIRNGKVIATGTAKDLQMFNKSLDELCKGDNGGIIFEKEEGATPATGDIVVKYLPSHVVDTSDIIN